jgi:hypothetical protein
MNLSDIQTQVVNIVKKYPITYAALFGSIAKGVAGDKSDVDILFDYDRGAKFTLFDMVGIQNELEDVLKKEVDFVPLRGLKAEIKDEVISSAVKIYEKR